MDGKNIIQEDPLKGKIEELNKCTNSVEGLVGVLKEIQIELNGCLSEACGKMSVKCTRQS